MFDSKKTKLWTNDVKTTSVKSKSNAFVDTAMKNSAETVSGNGAKKYKEHSNDFVTQFNMLGTYKTPRTFSEIEKDQEKLWANNKLLTVAFSLYLRMITRKTDVFGAKTKEPQRGGELKHEGIMRMIWLHMKAPKTFWKNVTLLITVGSWKDIFTMLKYDLVHHGWEGKQLNWDKFGKLILGGLNDENQMNLLKKYLPQIKSKSACKTVDAQANTMIAKWICSLVYGNKEGNSYKQYRKMKSSGTAHEWQQLISQGKHDLIDFNKVHGRALNKMVRSKFLENQGLTEKYENWVSNDSTDVKYTGFVHELFENLPQNLSALTKGKQETINKQFNTLVEKAKGTEDRNTSLIVVRDTSGSMSSTAKGTNMSSYDIAKAMALYFSEYLTGHFEDAWIEFNNDAKMHKWKGAKPLEKWYNDHSSYIGGTNFQSVVNLFVRLKKQGVSESDFPTGILCISDGEFNSAQLNKTNVETAKDNLRRAEFSNEYVENFVICLWNIPNGYYRDSTPKFETFDEMSNIFYMSGYSASTVQFLMNDIKTASDLFTEAMNQEVLNLVQL